jgi:hypothetical protein
MNTWEIGKNQTSSNQQTTKTLDEQGKRKEQTTLKSARKMMNKITGISKCLSTIT